MLFLIAQLGGLLLVMVSYSPTVTYVASTGTQQGNFLSTLVWLIINIVLAVIVILLILRFYRGDIFYKLLEAYIILFGSFFLFLIIIGDLFSSAGILDTAIVSGILSVALLIFKQRTKRFRNIITLITSIGAGVFLGISAGLSMGFLLLYLFFAAFAVYDYVAVFVLKFMIPLAKEASSRNLAFLIGSSDVEIIPVDMLNRKERAEYRKLKLNEIKDPAVKRLVKAGNMPALSSVMLGNGDIMLPLMLNVGAYVIYGNVFLSLSIAIGAAAGLYMTMLLLKRYKVGLPAIPPLFTAISIALFIAFAIVRLGPLLLMALFLFAAVASIAMMLITLERHKRAPQSKRPG